MRIERKKFIVTGDHEDRLKSVCLDGRGESDKTICTVGLLMGYIQRENKIRILEKELNNRASIISSMSNPTLESAVDYWKERAVSRAKRNAECCRRIDEMTDEANILKSKIELQETEISALRVNNCRLTVECNRLKSKVAELRDPSSCDEAAYRMIEELKRDLLDKNASVRALKMETADLNAEVSRLRTALEHANSRADAYYKHKNDLQDLVVKLNSEVKEKTETIREIHAEAQAALT